MIARVELKELYIARDLIDHSIQSRTHSYIAELNGKRGIYITDHAIVRYLERIKGHSFDNSDSDLDKLDKAVVDYKTIRDEMLTLDEDREILQKRLNFFRRGPYGYVIKGLSIITVIKF